MLEIIENTHEAIDDFHKRGWGREHIEVTKEQLQALLDGKVLALDDGEYTHTFYLKKDDE